MTRLRGIWRMGALGGLAVALLAAPQTARAADEPPAAVLEAERQRIEAIDRAQRAAISIFARGGRGGGSGVVITPDGYALTNFHVVKPAGNFVQCGMSDGNLYDAVIVGSDPVGDVALIKLFGRDDFPTAEIGDSDTVRVGDWCFAVGNPFLLATDFQPTVTWGLVSGVNRYQHPAGSLLEYADCIQTDASINPGNSGGPLFNAQGQLIGINGRGSFEKRGRVNVGVGYAISINQIKKFMGHLHSGRILDHATLGAVVSSDEEGRVVVTNILDSSDAYRRGLRYGDEIVSFGGRAIGSVNTFKNVLGTFPKGWRVPLTYRRDGRRYEIYVRLAGVHSDEELIKKIEGAGPPRAIPLPPRERPEQPPGGDDDAPQPDDAPEQPAPPPEQPEEGGPPPDPGPQPGEDPNQPRPGVPIPIERLLRGQEAPPPHLAPYFKARRGYANYYFNELNRQRVWDAFRKESDFTGLAGPWTLTGRMVDGGAVKIVLGDEQVIAEGEGISGEVDLSRDLDGQLAPAGSGGLLTALHLWKRLLVEGPEKFGEVYYLGTAPLLGRDELADVLVGTHDVVRAHFHFDPASGQLLSVEFYPERDADPCEVYFDQYRPVDGRLAPHRMRVLYGDDVFGVLEIEQIELPAPAGEKEAS